MTGVFAMPWKAPINAALPFEPVLGSSQPMLEGSKSQPLVIPVRYVAAGEVVHATSRSISIDDVHVRSVRPPEPGLSIGLKLYFPGGGVLSRSALVAESTGEEFRAEFNDEDELARQRLSEALWRREMSLRPYPRFHTQLQVVMRERGQPRAEGYVTNISRSGAFIRVDSLPERGSVVELELSLPEGRAYSVHAYVVHLAERRGVGVQFIGASDEFSAQLEEYLAKLAR
jgi:hypothetical protein